MSVILVNKCYRIITGLSFLGNSEGSVIKSTIIFCFEMTDLLRREAAQAMEWVAACLNFGTLNIARVLLRNRNGKKNR